jgi:hypothetical protein
MHARGHMNVFQFANLCNTNEDFRKALIDAVTQEVANALAKSIVADAVLRNEFLGSVGPETRDPIRPLF